MTIEAEIGRKEVSSGQRPPRSTHLEETPQERAGGESVINCIPSKRLDFLRGLAAVYVVIAHARGSLFAGGLVLAQLKPLRWPDYVQLAILQVTSLGPEAVILFFVLSGFAMAQSIRYSASTKLFYAKRIVRIWPPYLLAVGFAFGIAFLVMNIREDSEVKNYIISTPWGTIDFVRMSFYTHVDTVLTAQFWSLPYEVLFYLMCPFVLRNSKQVRIVWAMSIIIAGITTVLTSIYNDPTAGKGLVYEHFCMLLIFFMTGALSYYHQHLIPRIPSFRLLVIVCAYAGFLWLSKYRIFHGWNLITSLLTIPLALILIQNVPARIYNTRWLNGGYFSYSIYLFHVQLIMLIAFFLERYAGIDQSNMTSYWGWALSVPPILFVSWIFYLIGEGPCSQLVARWRKRDRLRMEPVYV